MSHPRLITSSLLAKAGRTKKAIGFSPAKSATNEKQTTMSHKILLPGEFKKASRKELIDKFLNDWLTEKQQTGMKPWCAEMLDAFATELLLNVQMGGMDRFLMGNTFSAASTHWSSIAAHMKNQSRFNLPLVPPKPKKMKVDIEDLGSDLTSEVRLLPVHTKKEEDDEPPDPVG